jgi:hypothetical protein
LLLENAGRLNASHPAPGIGNTRSPSDRGRGFGTVTDEADPHGIQGANI